MNPNNVPLHPDFPNVLWVVVEQPPGAPHRFNFRPNDGTFHVTEYKSLLYDRGWPGAYGWVGGLGTPPDPHVDVILITRQPCEPGDVLAAHTCGIFYRRDGDHKVVALDDALRSTVTQPDLSALDSSDVQALHKLYPIVGEGEGWFGAEEAFAYLLRGEGYAG